MPGYKPYTAWLMLSNWLADSPWPALPPVADAGADADGARTRGVLPGLYGIE